MYASGKTTGTVVDFDEDALQEIAERAYRMRTGARGLVTVVEGILQPIMYELPKHTGIKEIKIKREHLEEPKRVIAKVLNAE